MTPIKPRPALIVYDCDRRALREATELVRGFFEVLATSDPKQTLQWMQTRGDVVAVICELDAQASIGPKLLETVGKLRPNTRRIGVTSFKDLSVVVPGLHSGSIQELVQKPLIGAQLLAALRVTVPQPSLRKSA